MPRILGHKTGVMLQHKKKKNREIKSIFKQTANNKWFLILSATKCFPPFSLVSSGEDLHHQNDSYMHGFAHVSTCTHENRDKLMAVPFEVLAQCKKWIMWKSLSFLYVHAHIYTHHSGCWEQNGGICPAALGLLVCLSEPLCRTYCFHPHKFSLFLEIWWPQVPQ